MEENRKRRKKDFSEMKNYVFFQFFFEKCAKDNSKTQVFFFDQIFLSVGRVTTRRVNITIVHIKRERIGKKSREKVKRINHFLKVFFGTETKRYKIFSQKKH